VLQLRRRQWLEMVGHSFDHLPEEACGLLVGVPGGPVSGQEIVGVMHSHTHTDAYPSPTDVERAALLGDWHFLIVSLRHAEAQARCYRITEGNVTEEPIDLLGG